MRTFYIISLSAVLAFMFNGCISRRIIQEIDFKNLAGDVVKITYQKPKEAVILSNGNSMVFDISSTNFIRIAFSDSSTFFKYDLSNLDMNATAEKKSGRFIWGHIHWLYSCTINKDKTLTFKRIDKNGSLRDITFEPHVEPR